MAKVSEEKRKTIEKLLAMTLDTDSPDSVRTRAGIALIDHLEIPTIKEALEIGLNSKKDAGLVK